MRNLNSNEILQLEKQGCSAIDWNLIYIDPELDLSKIQHVYFKGEVNIHKGVTLTHIPGGICGVTIKEDVVIENVASIEFDPDARFGVGVMVSVLDETGSRAVPIYPGMSSQIATLMARDPEWLKKITENSLSEFLKEKTPLPEIGEKAVLRNCGRIKNVSIDREVSIKGASHLENGSLINNAAPGKCITFIGSGVEAENFILEDGKIISQSAVSNCYIGQGTIISLGFTAHDSIFFSNCNMQNGESHALLAGPFTVSMHKGTLLIGCQTSFMNAGSLSNQSNHMYKLGPVHWGVLERGVKTSSGSYLMLGAKIGAYSLLMGSHKNHPDSSEFPFSYLFSEERGATIVAPALMLRSCGLLRDEKKWPSRDQRLNRGLPYLDHITFPVLNPFTVDTMLNAIPIIEKLLSTPSDDYMYVRYKGMKFTREALEMAKSLYNLAIFKYLSLVLPHGEFPEKDDTAPEKWVDLGGQIMPRSYLNRLLESNGIPEAEKILAEADENYKALELQWIGRRFDNWWRQRAGRIKLNAERFDELVEEDQRQYMNTLQRETDMLAL